MEQTKSIFEEHNQNIFADVGFLVRGYKPTTLTEILHRDSEIKQYAYALSRAMQGITPDNIILYGQTGTGKTVLTRMITSQLETDANKNNIKIKTVYINCETTHTDIGIFKQIASKLSPENIMKKTLNSFDAHFMVFCDAMKVFNGIPIIILDEIDKLANPDILNIFARIKENEFVDKNMCLIGITNDLKFKEKLDPRTLSALSKSTILFRPYTADHLRDILTQRAKEAFKSGALSETVIPLCAALAAQEHGDARRAIDLLRVSGEIASKHGAKSVTEDHVYQANNLIELDEVTETIRVLPLQSQIILAACAYLEDKSPQPPCTGDVYNVYKRFCNKLGIAFLTQRRLTDILSYLDMFGILNLTVLYKGRYGRTKEVSLALSTNKIWTILYENPRFEAIREVELTQKQTLLGAQP